MTMPPPNHTPSVGAPLIAIALIALLVSCQSPSKPLELEETQFSLIPKGSEQARAKDAKNRRQSPYSCLISTLADDKADYNYWNRAFWLEFPEKVIKEANGKVVMRAIALGSEHAGSKAGSWQGVDNVVRVAQCLIPDSPLAVELLDDQLRKFGEGTWLEKRRSEIGLPKQGDSTNEWVCGATFTVFLCMYNPNTNLYYNCVESEPICAYWVYVYEDPIGGGGGGSGFPSDDPGECDPLGIEVCYQGPGGSQPPPNPPNPCTIEPVADFCSTPALCLGNPVPSPTVTPSNGWNVKGGMHGWTRNEGSRFHDGIDISSSINSNLFTLHNGIVIGRRKAFSPGEYSEVDALGIFITIESVIHGQTVRLTYAHLNYVNVAVGQAVYAGQIIGMTGNTGNAQSKGSIVVTPHVHIRARTLYQGQEVAVDPNYYMATKYNPDGSVNLAASTCIP